jgi:SAM-dependent methyltransferase
MVAQQEVNVRSPRRYEQGRDYRVSAFQEISAFLEFVVPSAPKIALDIGCGTGQLTRELWHRGYRAVGIDVSTTAVEIARSLTVLPPDQISYIHLDIESEDIDSLPDAPYGLITCKFVYALIREKLAFLEKVKCLLSETGAFVVITPQPEDVPPEKARIAATGEDMALLSSAFNSVVSYRKDGLTYWIGGKG